MDEVEYSALCMDGWMDGEAVGLGTDVSTGLCRSLRCGRGGKKGRRA